MSYKCQFPGCDFTTEDRTQIEWHHIKPKADGGSNKAFNRVWLCSSCHRKVYIPNQSTGIHKKNNSEKIELLGWQFSSGGYLLEYKLFAGESKYHLVGNREQ